MFASLVLATLLFFSAPNAAGLPFAQNPDRKTAAGAHAARSAKDIAQAFDAHYRRVQTMTGFFLEKYTSGGAGLVAESGTVYFEKPGRMRWDYDSPETKMFLVDGKQVWYYVPAEHTASRTTVKESDDWRTPLALLAGKVNLQRLCGSLTLGDSAGEAGNAVLVCRPRKADEETFREVKLEVNSRDQLERLDIQEPGDIETEFRFGDWHENVAIEASKFHFEPPVGVAIVDDAKLGVKVQ